MDIVSIDSFLTSSECSFVLSFAIDFKKSGITIRGKDTFNDYRISQDCSSNNVELIEFLKSKLSSLNIISIPNPGFIKYLPGSRFMLHRDRDDLRGLFPYRYKTLIIQLSSSSEYTGGDLIVENTIMPRTVGSLILFNSKYLHEVTEVGTGVRYSLCLFLTEDNFKSKLL